VQYGSGGGSAAVGWHRCGVEKDFAACCKTVGSAERRKLAQRISMRRVSSNTPSLHIEAQRPLGQIFMDVEITESKLSRRYRGKSDLYYG
jgi:hypothetical protein